MYHAACIFIMQIMQPSNPLLTLDVSHTKPRSAGLYIVHRTVAVIRALTVTLTAAALDLLC